MAMADMAPAVSPSSAASHWSSLMLGRSTAITPRKPSATAVMRTASRCAPPQPSIQQAMNSGAV